MSAAVNPVEQFLRMDRIPHIWCPGCGIGTTVNCFVRALLESKLDLNKVVVVSGIGCTGRVAGYVKLDSFHTTHGRAIPFATGMKLANPDLTVVVYSGDGDLTAIGGDPVEKITAGDVWPDGNGLVLMGEDGGIFALGSAPFMGRVVYG